VSTYTDELFGQPSSTATYEEGWSEPYIYTVYGIYIRKFWQRNHQIYGVYIRFCPTLPMSADIFGHLCSPCVQPLRCVGSSDNAAYLDKLANTQAPTHTHTCAQVAAVTQEGGQQQDSDAGAEEDEAEGYFQESELQGTQQGTCGPFETPSHADQVGGLAGSASGAEATVQGVGKDIGQRQWHDEAMGRGDRAGMQEERGDKDKWKRGRPAKDQGGNSARCRREGREGEGEDESCQGGGKENEDVERPQQHLYAPKCLYPAGRVLHFFPASALPGYQESSGISKVQEGAKGGQGSRGRCEYKQPNQQQQQQGLQDGARGAEASALGSSSVANGEEAQADAPSKAGATMSASPSHHDFGSLFSELGGSAPWDAGERIHAWHSLSLNKHCSALADTSAHMGACLCKMSNEMSVIPCRSFHHQVQQLPPAPRTLWRLL
jgi:hypothetical protein